MHFFVNYFFGHACAEDLMKKVEEDIQELDMKKMDQVSVDEPSVNWKLYDRIVEERNKKMTIQH